MKVFIDWSDPAYPAIRPVYECWDPDDEITMTLAEAKRRICQHADSLIEHWRGIKADRKAVRASDFKDVEERS